MVSSITLTASMRSNLSSLRSLAEQMSTTQTRLSTGKKVNSAIDNASSFYQARALTNRAGDLDSLLDSMGQGIQTISSAMEGIEAGLNIIEQMKSVAQSAIGNIDNLPQIRQAGSPLSNISPMFDGRSNTQAIVDQIGEKGLAAYACNQFYAPGVSADDENFGQGKWYLPAIGELVDAYGEYECKYYKSDTDWNQIEITKEEYAQLQDNGYFIKYEYNYESYEENLTIINQAEYDQFVAEYGDTWVSTATGGIFVESGLNFSIDIPNSDNVQAINDTLSLLASQGSEATTLNNGYYWSSFEFLNNYSWILDMSNGTWGGLNKHGYSYVRVFQLLENCFTPLSLSSNAASPQIGDVMYSDLSYSDKDHIDTSKTAVGVVTWVSADGASARIMSLKDLTFSSDDQVGNFEPANPYGGAQVITHWCTSDKRSEDITGVDNVDYDAFVSLYLSADHGSGGTDIVDFSTYTEQFNAIYSQYDAMVKDASYQGINLLNGGNLNVMFNETRTHDYTVQGQVANANALGVSASHWETLSDVKASIAQLQAATSTLRNIAEALGNHLSIIETRMNFTDAMTDILQTGADDLVLADMNEESANYLALQTRQQLAVNALALASQASNSVLQLF